MNKKQIGLSLVLADFVALTAYAVYQYGYMGFFEVIFANAISLQIFVDLVIALTFVVVWMWRDAQQRGIMVVPYVLLTFGLGSIGPLLYLIRIVGDAPAPALAPGHAHA